MASVLAHSVLLDETNYEMDGQQKIEWVRLLRSCYNQRHVGVLVLHVSYNEYKLPGAWSRCVSSHKGNSHHGRKDFTDISWRHFLPLAHSYSDFLPFSNYVLIFELSYCVSIY